MIYQVFDCLSNTEIARCATKNEADALCEIHGGADACIHVFEVEEIADKKPQSELF